MKTFLAITISVDMLAKNELMPQMKTCFHVRRTCSHTIKIGQCTKFEHAWCKTNELSLTCTQTILSHCFDFILQSCLGEWDRAFARLPTYLCHRGSGQDVVQENRILKKNDFFFFFFEMRFHFFFEKQQISFFFFFFFWEQEVILWTTILANQSV